MYVSPRTFEMQVKLLKSQFEIVDLGEWVERRARGESLPKRACAITFDDGWRDNYDFALPILVRECVPVTVFLVADLIGGNYRFWPSRLAELLRNDCMAGSEMPRTLNDVIRGCANGIAASSSDIDSDGIEAAINQCKMRFTDAEMEQLLNQWAPQDEMAMMTRDLLDRSEIEELKNTGLVKFGSHTCRHTRLGEGTPPSVVRYEVGESGKILGEMLGTPIRLFCYPNGEYSPVSLAAVREAYSAAVTTGQGWNDIRTDMHLLRRVLVHEDISADKWSFMARVSLLA